MDAPSDQELEKVKAAYSDRALRLVEMHNDGESLFFVMTGPNRIEHQKFQDELIDARAVKDEKEQQRKLYSAIEKAALAQIRWPERDQVRVLFDQYPSCILNFAKELNDAAGDSFEVRSKKL